MWILAAASFTLGLLKMACRSDWVMYLYNNSFRSCMVAPLGEWGQRPEKNFGALLWAEAGENQRFSPARFARQIEIYMAAQASLAAI